MTSGRSHYRVSPRETIERQMFVENEFGIVELMAGFGLPCSSSHGDESVPHGQSLQLYSERSLQYLIVFRRRVY
jgi:hypothetical protein